MMSVVHCQLQILCTAASGRGSFSGRKPCRQLSGTSIIPLLLKTSDHHSFPAALSIDSGCRPLQASLIPTTLPSPYASRLSWFAQDMHFNMVPWRWASRAIFIYFCCLTLAAEAHEYHPPPPPPMYACEDVSYYYAPLDSSKGQALKRKLHSIISNHKSLSYREVWDALKILDAADVDKPEASSDIVEIYSLKVVPKALAGKPEGWNREHLWPRSYGLTRRPSLTDLHNIRPADVNVNSSRGNKFYGECNSELHKCLKPANKEAAPGTETDDKSWTPPMPVRGDIARALMYMAVCYGHHQPDGAPALQLSDSPSIRNREMGILSTLLKWNRLDPPSREEKLRNERVCKLYQHNRNPFIDHPEYADLIWTARSRIHQNHE
uniref:Uncharacterized protein n=1 Tax=Kalanchoe fedtschenkoi TaxID=63787 RepID=A0A7N0VHA6_KALFE